MKGHWILSYAKDGFKVVTSFGTLDAMFDFIIENELPRFKAKRM